MAAITFSVRSPGPNEKRVKFSIFRIEGKSPKRVKKVVCSPELDEINRRFISGTLSYQEARALAQDIRRRLDRRENGAREKPITTENQTLLDAYWKDQYSWRDITDPDSMRNSLKRAIRVLGDLPIMTAEQTDFYQRINESGITNNRKREVIARLNQLIKYARRDFTLRLPRQDFLKIRHISEEQLGKLTKVLTQFDSTLVSVAFYTGGRIGEIFAIQKRDFNGRILNITRQILRNGEKSRTKTRKDRGVAVPPEGFAAIKDWLDIPTSQKLEHRNRKLSEVVSEASRKLWPKEKDRHITFHDLRHSFAIHMLRLEFSISEVAHLLGDSIQVCQAYYTGFAASDEALEAMSQRLANRK